MTALAQARDEQARASAWLREHAAWKNSDELVDVPGHGRMRARTAYAGALAGCLDCLMEEVLVMRATVNDSGLDSFDSGDAARAKGGAL